MLAVIDTNVLVSALMSPMGKPAQILQKILTREIQLCLDGRIYTEYIGVLSRPKLRFDPKRIELLLDFIEKNSIWVNADPCTISFVDESDKKFYEVAKACSAILITGNTKHFPVDPIVKTVHDV